MINDTFICLDRWDEKLVLLTLGCSPRSRQFSHEKYKHRRRLTQVIIARADIHDKGRYHV